MSSPAAIALTASTVLSMLQPVAQAIETSAHIKPETAKTVNQTMQVVTAATQELAKADAFSDTKPIIEELVSAAQTVIGVAMQMPLPASVTPWLAIAQCLLPGLAAVVTVIETHHTTPVAPVAP